MTRSTVAIVVASAVLLTGASTTEVRSGEDEPPKVAGCTIKLKADCYHMMVS